ncbi:TauD/TfdA family dioxygenase [Nocardiopsis changdeensis]|uniref:TauD/TfdA family dioxygenase n=1 Tax=Nocardiopsis changdeensis TaxID=2831969 RepID=UPI003F460614
MTDRSTLELGWTTDDLENRPSLWTTRLDDAERDALWADAAKGDWNGAVPVRERLRSFLSGGLGAVGFAHVSNAAVASRPESELASGLLFLLRALGEVIPQNAEGALTRVLRDQDGDGATELAFHCDTCDVLVLLCLQPAADGGGRTRLASARTARDIIRREYPGALAELEGDWTFDRTGRAGEQVVVTPILFTGPDGTSNCYYQPRTVRTSPERGGPPLTDRQWEALETLDGVLYRPEVAFTLGMEAGDLLLLRNSRVLHARTAYTDEPGPRARRILRAWMSAEEL